MSRSPSSVHYQHLQAELKSILEGEPALTPSELGELIRLHAQVGEKLRLAFTGNDAQETPGLHPISVQQSLLDAILGADPAGIAVLAGQELRFVFANPSYRLIVPEPYDDPVGKTYEEVWPLKSWSSSRDRLKQALETGQPFQVSGVEHCFPDGDRRIFLQQVRRIEWGGKHAVFLQMWDITEEKKIEQSLRESDELRRLALAASHAGVWSWDLRSDQIQWSDEYYQIFGFEPGTLQPSAKAGLMRVHPEDRKRVEALIRGAMETGRDIDEIHRVVWADRSVHWVRGISRVFFDKQGKPERMTGIALDITESRQAEQELSKIHEQLVKLAVFSEEDPNPVARVTSTGKVIYRNPAARKLPGWSLEIGKPLPAPMYLLVERALLKHKSAQQDVQLADRFYSVAVTPVPTKFYLNVYGQDITERKKAEETLAANEARIRELLGSIRDGFMQLDREWRFTYVNQRAANNVGYEPEALIGKDLFEVFPASRGTEHERIYREVMETRQPAEFTTQGAMTSQWYDIRVYPSHEGISVFWVDISERVQAEELARESAAGKEVHHRLLEQREQERLKIARDLHDGPIQEILGAMYAIQGMLAEDETSNLAGELRGVVDVLQRQVSELRDYAGILRPPALSKFGLEKAVRGHAETFQEKHPDIRVTIEAVQEGPLLPEEMRLAFFRIYQEAMNNIARHCSKAAVRITFEKEDAKAWLQIEDNGPGFEVPKDWLELARAGHLGLVGMRERAEAIGGELVIESAPGRGTRIRVTVPLRDETETI